MELEMLDKKVSDIVDAIGRIETKLEELEDKIDDIEVRIVAKIETGNTEIKDEVHDVYVTCDGIDSEVKNIEGYCSYIYSNIDQLKD